MKDGLHIVALGQHGDGRTADGSFIPRVLPGEVVTPEGRVITPSADRVKPPCKHYKTCGGCQLQHASDALVADWKLQVVRDALAYVGLTPELREIETSPPRSRRRASFSARRTKSGAMAGFHMRGSDAVVDVMDCPVLAPGLQDGLAVARALAVCGASRKAELSAQMTLGLDGLDVAVTGGKPLDAALLVALPQAMQDFAVARLTWDGEPVFQTTTPRVALAGVTVTPPPNAFLQATAHGEAALQRAVAEAIGDATHIADLFCGCGTFALALAPGRRVQAAEADATMLTSLRGAADKAGFDIQTLRRNLFSEPLIPDELAGLEAVILDPPRAGAAAQVRELAQSDVPRIAYVSCDPTSFARDAKILTDGGYDLLWVQVVDQFRWSPHIELAAAFIRA